MEEEVARLVADIEKSPIKQIPAILFLPSGTECIMFVEKVHLWNDFFFEGYIKVDSLSNTDHTNLEKELKLIGSDFNSPNYTGFEVLKKFKDKIYAGYHSSRRNIKAALKPDDWIIFFTKPLKFSILDIFSLSPELQSPQSKSGLLGWKRASNRVFVNNNLPISIESHRNLVDIFDTFSRDELKTGVYSIINPDYAPNYYYPEGYFQIQKLKNCYIYQDCIAIRNPETNRVEGRMISKLIKSRNKVYERLKYAWFASEIFVNKNGKIKLLGPIHGLDYHKYHKYYESIIEVFEKMYFPFQSLGSLILAPFQIVVKAEKIVVMPGEKYDSKWGYEGVTENVKNVGIYFCEVDDNIVNKSISLKHFYTYEKEVDVNGIEYSTGSAVVYPNSYTVKSASIVNYTNSPLRVLVLKFMNIENHSPLQTTTHWYYCYKYLKDIRRLPEGLTRKIISYLYCVVSNKKAIKRWNIVNRELDEGKSGWILRKTSLRNSYSIFYNGYVNEEYLNDYNSIESIQEDN
ncbi:hypothetical protein SteCoe_4847 [Stentor coeruleus]|uniref:Uncharacterized protein n=1 Tax=Stentor coeruleus TaxID=5963 RepID=A0A1R2CTV8_9CILI|nr:hypothetical protein SteCoe_4847 [Stentor coeruleus]